MKPRILMIIPFFYPHVGGAERQAFELAKNFIRAGISVSVLTRKTGCLPSFETVQGISIYRRIRVIQRRTLFGLTYMLSIVWALYKQRASYDIIHCHILGLHAPVAILAKWLLGKKVIIKVAASGLLSDFRTIRAVSFGGFLLSCVKHADRVITVCSLSTREALHERFPPASVIQIPNGVDARLFSPHQTKSRVPGKITFVGRLDAMKGVHVLLQAFHALSASGLSACLYIIGDGPERSNLEDIARKLGIHKQVTFTGEISQVVDHLRESELFVFPSFSEGLSNVLLEAMACGLPVVATRVGGNTDLIADGSNGLLVDPENIEQLAGCMEAILKNKSNAARLGAEARKTIERYFAIEHVAANYIELYKSIFSSRP